MVLLYTVINLSVDIYLHRIKKTKPKQSNTSFWDFFFLFPSENEQTDFLATPVLQWLTGLCSRVTEVTQVSGGALSALQHLRI